MGAWFGLKEEERAFPLLKTPFPLFFIDAYAHLRLLRL